MELTPTGIVVGLGGFILTASLALIGRRTEKAIDRVDDHETRLIRVEACTDTLKSDMFEVKEGIKRIETILLNRSGQ